MAADLERAVEHYRTLAPRYDHYTRRINAIRLRTIEALGLKAGDVVVDAGCGTGWCLPRLAAAVGPTGRVLAFDPSPDMLHQARRRMPGGGAALELVQATGEDVRLPARANAVLFSYTHDLIRSRRALANLFGQAAPGARVAATSTKLYAPWLAPANWYLRYTHRAYITNFESFEAPWSLLAELLDGFHVETAGWTQHYVATGTVRAQAA
jgi:demethylmenaquinone methyltransferase/2-methoxy-6-polyprenyl-1,4-benzoquinol methylase